MAPSNHNQYETWDKQFLWHPFTQATEWEKKPTFIVASGKGVYLKDLKGRRYLDGVSSLWVNIHGHRHPVLDRAVKTQLSKIAHSTFLGQSHVPAIELARDLVKLAPRGLSRVFYSDSGATAVEVALKMAFQYWVEKTPKAPVRDEFLALKGSYHGDTIGAVSVGSIGAFHSKFKPLLFKTNFAMAPACVGCPFNKTGIKNRFRTGEKVTLVPKPGDKRAETGCKWECLGSVEKILKERGKKISAGIIEPVMQAAGGMNSMPPGYLAGFSRLLKKHNALMIVDEVATGFCRTGTLFATEQEKATPDFLCLAKGLTGGYSPLAATLATEKVYRAFRAPYQKFKTFFHGHSYTGHPLGCAVARANLKLIKTSKLLEKSRRMAHLLRMEIHALSELPQVKSIRQAGLMMGVELDTDRKGMLDVCKRLLSDGVWLRPLGNVLVILPPPVITEKEIRKLVRSVKSAISNERRK